jgi:hypothetical protein
MVSGHGFKACPEPAEGCRKWPIQIPALAAEELQIAKNKTAGAKAQHDLAALSARLKSCPDAYCSLNEVFKRPEFSPISTLRSPHPEAAAIRAWMPDRRSKPACPQLFPVLPCLTTQGDFAPETVRKLALHLVLLPLAGALACGPAGTAQSGAFTISQHGHPVGTASFNFIAGPRGYSSTSVVRIAMQGLDYALSKSEQLSASNQLRHAQLSATVNGSAVNVTAGPDAAQILVNISASGRSSTIRLDPHPGAVFLPDFDPGALETLLALGVARNNSGLWAIVPKQTGAQIATIQPIQLATYADERGTLDGKPVTVHHLVATIAGAATHLFSGPQNQLLQAELPQQGFALIRKGFVLTPPAKPGAPPDSGAPPSQH